MHFVAFTTNDTSWLIVPGVTCEHDIPVFVVMHERQSMADINVIASMVDVWKKTFHPSELPITPEGYSDAAHAFCEWLSETYGYEIPDTMHRLASLPIFDSIEVPE